MNVSGCQPESKTLLLPKVKPRLWCVREKMQVRKSHRKHCETNRKNQEEMLCFKEVVVYTLDSLGTDIVKGA